jgi:ABC-type multidrug transport system fused ATPase/permease subunit
MCWCVGAQLTAEWREVTDMEGDEKMLDMVREKTNKAKVAPASARGTSEAQSERAGEVSGLLSLGNVEAFYGSFRAVSNVSLEVQPRAVTALIGSTECMRPFRAQL